MVVADPDEALIEAIAEVIRAHRVEVYLAAIGRFGWHCLTCGEEREPLAHSIEVAEQDALAHSARAAYAAMVEHLGLVEETIPAGYWARDSKPMRRLVSRWTEVDHGSE